MDLHIGQRVECIKEDAPPTLLTKGQHYTVSSLIGAVGVTVSEIDLRGTPWFGFRVGYFRPLTDISDLTAILNGKRIQLPDLVDEPARSSLADRFVGTVGVLAGGLGICWAVMLAEFLGGQ